VVAVHIARGDEDVHPRPIGQRPHRAPHLSRLPCYVHHYVRLLVFERVVSGRTAAVGADQLHSLRHGAREPTRQTRHLVFPRQRCARDVAAEPRSPSQNQCLHYDSQRESCDSRSAIRSRRTDTLVAARRGAWTATASDLRSRRVDRHRLQRSSAALSALAHVPRPAGWRTVEGPLAAQLRDSSLSG
jgi:hypothetical protein